MRRAVVSLSALLLISVATTAVGGSAGATEAPHGVERITIYVHPATHRHRHVLILSVYPLEGVVTVGTLENERTESDRGVNYVGAIPKGPDDGSLDLHLPGLGEVVGTVSPTRPLSPAARAKLCGEPNYHSERATFEGKFVFRGAGGYGRWKAAEAEAEFVPECGGDGESRALHRPLPEPGLSGDFIRFFARAKTRRRLVEFDVVGDRRFERDAQLIAVDEETLPGEVVVQRWVERKPVPFKRTVSFAQETNHPSSITFTPPAPFYGRATYRRSTRKLTGSLGVRFLGLSLRLARPPAPAVFEDEEPQRKATGR